jgi:hypothetical protein
LNRTKSFSRHASDRLIRRELEPAEIDRYADRKGAEFDEIVDRVMTLRSDFYRIFLREAVSVVSKERAEVRQRWQWLADTENFISGIVQA